MGLSRFHEKEYTKMGDTSIVLSYLAGGGQVLWLCKQIWAHLLLTAVVWAAATENQNRI